MRSAAAALALLALAAAPAEPAGRASGAGAPAPTAPGSKAAFDSGRAFEHVRQLVAIGPRHAGSVGSQQARRYILDQAKALGVAAAEQPLVASTPYGPVNMANVILTLPGASADRIILGGHYDTKLFREFRFVGANDGGSSAAMLLEFARALKDRRNPFTIELVFFDGEEAFVEWTGTDHTYGSRYYVQQAQKAGTLKGVRAMLLVDMVGDRDLAIRREARSTKWLTDTLWASAKRLGYGAHFLDQLEPIEDDHQNFLAAGVPAVNLIDLEYRAWHTAEDTLDKVSARSLQVVGDVVLDALPAIERWLGEKK
jgi:Zn-dependent M28 family amino/carboxypeptidase